MKTNCFFVRNWVVFFSEKSHVFMDFCKIYVILIVKFIKMFYNSDNRKQGDKNCLKEKVI